MRVVRTIGQAFEVCHKVRFTELTIKDQLYSQVAKEQMSERPEDEVKTKGVIFEIIFLNLKQ